MPIWCAGFCLVLSTCLPVIPLYIQLYVFCNKFEFIWWQTLHSQWPISFNQTPHSELAQIIESHRKQFADALKWLPTDEMAQPQIAHEFNFANAASLASLLVTFLKSTKMKNLNFGLYLLSGARCLWFVENWSAHDVCRFHFHNVLLRRHTRRSSNTFTFLSVHLALEQMPQKSTLKKIEKHEKKTTKTINKLSGLWNI